MPQPKFEVAVGPVDGVNRVFSVSSGYRPGTTAVFLNGQLKRAQNDDGWTETNPSAGVLTLDVPPAVGDVVQVFFTGIVPHAEVDEEVTQIRGVLRATEGLEGTLRETERLTGVLVTMGALTSSLRTMEPLRGTLTAVEMLTGHMREEH